MRECWINVYPSKYGPHRFGGGFPSREQAGVAGRRPTKIGLAAPLYRLHVRLKVSALPVTDVLAAGKAGEGSHIQQEH